MPRKRSGSRRLLGLAVTTLLASACSMPSGLAPRPTARLTISRVTPAGQGVKVKLKAPAELLGKQLQALANNGYTRADIDHVRIKVFRMSLPENPEENNWPRDKSWPDIADDGAIGSFEISRNRLGDDIEIVNLLGYTTYRVTAEAYSSWDETPENRISTTDKRSWTDFTTPGTEQLFDDVYEAMYKLRLRDRAPMTSTTIYNDFICDNLSGLAYDAENDRLWLTNASAGAPRLQFIANPAATTPTPTSFLFEGNWADLQQPRAIALGADPMDLYVYMAGTSRVYKVDLRTYPTLTQSLEYEGANFADVTAMVAVPTEDDPYDTLWMAHADRNVLKAYYMGTPGATCTPIYDCASYKTVGANDEYPGYQDGSGTDARFFKPVGLARTLDSRGDEAFYVSENGEVPGERHSHQLRRIEQPYDNDYARVSTVVKGYFEDIPAFRVLAADEPAAVATLDTPGAMAADELGNVYILDGAKLKKVDAEGMVRTLEPRDANTGDVIDFSGASGICLDDKGFIYVADTAHRKVLRLK